MNSAPLHPRVFRESSAILGESLVWDAPRGDLLWCDISSGLLHRSPFTGAVDGADDRVISLPPPLASFHRASIGGEPGFVVSLGDRVVLVDAAGTIMRDLAAIPHAHAGLRMNEGKVDPAGRWVTGSMNLTTGEPDGAFYSIDPSGGVRVLRGGIGTANGIEWSDDGSRVYLTDTAAQSIYTGEYTPDGEILDLEVFHHGVDHDGLVRDAEGCFWGATYGGAEVVRYGQDAAVLDRIELPVPNVTSVAFGGPGLSTLFVTSAREKLTEGDLEKYPLSGSVFAIETTTSGFESPVFIVD